MNEETTLDLSDVWQIIRKRIGLILIVTFSATILSGVISFFVIKPTYEAKVSLVIGKTGGDKGTGESFNNSDVMMYQNLVKTYTVIADSKIVSKKAEKKLDGKYALKEIEGAINVAPKPNTQILEIGVKNKSAEGALEVIEAVTESFMEEGMRIFPSGDIKLIDKPELPKHPVSPNKKLNVLIGFVLGLMVSLGVAFLLEYMDKSLKTEDDVEKYLGLPVIGVIPKNVD